MATVISIGTGAADTRPTIFVTTEVADIVDLAIGALGADREIFQRDVYLMHIVRVSEAEANAELPVGAPQIRRLAAPTLLEKLTRVARWVKGPKHSEVVPPPTVVQAILARGEYPKIRTLVGILEAPSIRADGSIVQEAGYDRATGYLYIPSDAFPAVLEHPTQEQARRALELLEDVVRDFPFEKPALGRSVFVAMLLSVLVRPAIRGSVPGAVNDSNVRGSGKTLLADVVSLIATGRPAGRMTFATDPAQLEKVLSAFALRGAPLIVFDNVSELGGEPLDKVLTAIDQVDLRVLGKTEIVTLPWRAVIIATGNNVEILGDTSRRLLLIRLDRGHERPEERTDFRHTDLRAYVREHRAELVVAALTLIRAWHVAGRPGSATPWGSFEAWSGIIPGAIVYAGGADPMAARPTIAGVIDGETSTLAALLSGWVRLAPSEGLTVKRALDALYPSERVRVGAPPDGFDELREAIEAIAPPAPGKPPTANKVGYALRRYRRRVVAGQMLDCTPDRRGVARWVVRTRQGAGDAGDAGDVSDPSRERPHESSG